MSKVHDTCGGRFLKLSYEEYSKALVDWAYNIALAPELRIGQYFCNKYLQEGESFSDLYFCRNEDVSLYLWIEDDCKIGETWNPCMEGEEYE